MALAILGGKHSVTGELKPFNTIGREDAAAAYDAVMDGPLSGYLGGQEKGGYWVERLEDEWRAFFGVRHAVACNSATSGLLMACMASHVGQHDSVVVSPYTMSATAAAPVFLASNVCFGDIDSDYFCLQDYSAYFNSISTIATNLFGHPASLAKGRRWADEFGSILIEDNAQGFMAKENGKWAGTIGHIGVFSLNIHKVIQCGEGGVCVTNNDVFAHRLRMARNHGEMSGGSVGLNLRMTEVSAAIACIQLRKAKRIVAERVEIAETLTDMVKDIPGLTSPKVRDGCDHTYYCYAMKVAERRREFVQAMGAEGVPLREGYVEPLYRLPAFEKFARPCPVAERMQDHELVLYENCAFSPTSAQLKQMEEAFHKVADHLAKQPAAEPL